MDDLENNKMLYVCHQLNIHN